MATLRDVAEQASVSFSTASRVLNGSKPNHPVSPDVRAAVRQDHHVSTIGSGRQVTRPRRRGPQRSEDT
jgi:hypothetical protein